MSATCRGGGACGDKAGNVHLVCLGHSQLELATSSTSCDPRSPWGGAVFRASHSPCGETEAAGGYVTAGLSGCSPGSQPPGSAVWVTARPQGEGLRGSPPTQGPEDPAKVPLVKTLVVLH